MNFKLNENGGRNFYTIACSFCETIEKLVTVYEFDAVHSNISIMPGTIWNIVVVIELLFPYNIYS